MTSRSTHREKFGIRYFRVLTVTTTAARAENLRQAAAQEEDVRRLSRLFLFTDVGKLALERPERICECIWTTPAEPQPQSLLGTGPAKNPDERRRK